MSDVESPVAGNRKRSPLAIILFTVFLDLIGFGIVFPILPLYAEKYNASPFAIGALVAVYSAMTFLFAPVLGRISDRVGRRPVLLYSLIGSAIGFFVMGAADVLWLLFVARIIDGVSGGNISTAQAYIADITPPEKRAKSMGLIGAAFGVGFILGPALGGLMSLISLSAPFYLAGAMALLNAFLVYVRLPESLAHEHRSQPHEKAPIAEVFRHAKGPTLAAVMVTYMFSIAGFALMTTLYALYAQHRFGYSAFQIGGLLAFIGLIGAAIQGGLIGRLVQRFGEKALATTGAAILSASLFCLPLSGTLTTLLLVSAFLAVGNGLMTPTLNALASRSVGRSWQGRTMGLMQSCGSLGRLCGPLLAGWLLTFDVAGPVTRYAQTPFWVSSGIMLIAFVLTLTVWMADASETECA
jgi:multidrug resistance protein